jgi:NADPH2:quinone reductase
MKRVQFDDYGEPDVMHLADAPIPEPGPGQARVKIEAIGVNFIDIYQRSGLYRVGLPFTPGQEAAGTVEAVGDGVDHLKAGDRVAYSFVPGAYAEYAVIPAEKLVPVPQGLSSRVAAALMLQGMTAHYLSTDTFPIHTGHTVLVHAAAGGTGQLLVQMAKRRGARVFGTASTPEKAQLARDCGADEVFLYGDFDTGCKRLTNGHGVDVVYDSVGRDTFDRSLQCLRPRGMMVLFGQSSGPVPPFDPQILNARGSLFLTRPSLGHYILNRDELLKRAWDIFEWAASGQLNVRIDREFPLAQAADAHRALSSRATSGKVLLIP